MEDVLMLEGQPSEQEQEQGKQERDSPYGECIRNLRQRMGLTQQGLADRLNLHRVTISRLEKGETLPLPALLDRMGALAKEAAAEIKRESERLPQLKVGLLSGFELAQAVQEMERDANEGDENQDADEGDNNMLVLMGLGLVALFLLGKK